MDSLDVKILNALYNYYDNNPGESRMTFVDLSKAIDISVYAKEWKTEILPTFFTLRSKGWINYESLSDASNGFVQIEPDGMKIARTTKQQPEIFANIDNICHQIFPRKKLLTEIKRYINRKDSSKLIVLLGQPMAGKSTVLNHLAEALHDEYIPLTMTIKGVIAVNNLDDFALDLAYQLTNKLEHWAKRHNINLNLSEPTRNDFLNGNGKRAFYFHWKSIFDKLAYDKQPVVMIDEIEFLLDDPDELDERIIDFLHGLVCNSQNAFFILTAGPELRSKYPHSAKRKFRRLIGEGHTIPVPYLKEKNVKSFFSKIQYHFSEDDILECLVSLCDGFPKFILTMCKVICSLISDSPDKKVDENDVDSIFTDVIGLISPSLNRLRDYLSDDEFKVVQLISGLKTANPLCEFQYRLPGPGDSENNYSYQNGENQSRETTIALYKLERRGLIEWLRKEDNLFRFKLGIFLLWANRFPQDFTEGRYS